MRDLTLADFAPLRGTAIEVATAAGAFELVLAGVAELPASPRPGGSFRLEFHGPARDALAQGTYAFRLGSERHDIFIVPIGPIGETMRYEAIFF